MQVKTFKAHDMPEAMRMVKSEFGPDALIISSRKERRQGFMGRFSKPYFEVTAALDTPQRAVAPPVPERVKNEANTLVEFQKSMLAPIARELKVLRARVETLSVREQGGIRPAPLQPQPGSPVQRERAEAGPLGRAISNSDMDELKKVLLGSLGQTAHPAAKSPVPKAEPAGRGAAQALAALAEELRRNGVEESITAPLLKSVSEAAGRGEKPERLREMLNRLLCTSVNCAGAVKLVPNGSRIMALVGPTGVGKTTTIAKLAALAYNKGVSVALITIDTFRVGAVAQLQAYSGIMGIPMVVASTPDALKKAIAAHVDKQLVFIDTAGASPRERNKVNELKSFLDVDPAIETHLCLSATTRDSELSQAVARFGVLPISRMIFTKLDESMSFGCIVNTHLRNKLPLSYFTTGQNVPADIEAATSQRVANLVIREKKS